MGTYGWGGEKLVRATISEVKNALSAYLRKVRSGESVLVLDRNTPVARIVPVGRDVESPRAANDVDEAAKVARLERAGVLSRRSTESPLDVLGEPFPSGARILEALLEERAEGRRDGLR